MVTNTVSIRTPSTPRKRGWFPTWWGLIRWSLIRHKHLLPVFTAVQALFAFAIVYGLALLIPDVDTEVSAEAVRYLSSGAWTLGIIAVGCVLAPQIMSTSKQEGLLDYQKTLPVPRSAIFLADAVIWSLAALPGIAIGILAATLRFELDIHLDLITVAAILAAQFTTVSIGYAIAFWLPVNTTALVTQVIMIGGLLFSPITFPAERLPEWAVALHQFLPFAPLGDIIREAAFRTGADQLRNIIVVAAWAAATYLIAYRALQRRS
ncbi:MULTISPECIES: ABC transporter permease [unclassified Corynebacterium]|uniref:ABC transporter permease n=1 Tax=unclassified Corynebacterium TaxID=2624378 RepID=UPI0029C9B738|nr:MULTISPECIES: ABC transporter permease [unclassified Corynebacterium]WPF65673.1 ABC transporter permease [Corynebacterium sp. 22KM0430]WPF68169.1 ABC transporter permease [Corynebacterium sp. 21KM1197]